MALKKYPFRGGMYTMREIVRMSGLPEKTLRNRYDRHGSFDAGRVTPTFTMDGKTFTLRGWADELGIPKETLRRRLQQHDGDLAAAITGYRKKHHTYTPRGGIEIDGLCMTVNEWAKRLHVSTYTLYRLRGEHGGDMAAGIRELLEHGPAYAKSYTANGRTMTLHEWAVVLGVNVRTIYNRMSNGYPLDAVFLTAAEFTEYKRARRQASTDTEKRDLLDTARDILLDFTFIPCMEDLKIEGTDDRTGAVMMTCHGDELIEYRVTLMPDRTGDVTATMLTTGEIMCCRNVRGGKMCKTWINPKRPKFRPWRNEGAAV